MPRSLFFSLFENIKKRIPITAKTGENAVGFSNFTKKLSLSIPDKLKTQEVIVVPIFAPIIMGAACESRKSPELTNPTVITVVAEED